MSFTPVHTPSKQLGLELMRIIVDAGTYAPRSKQKAIGPSEAGTDCTRKLAYKLLDWEISNPGSGGNWAAAVGTAIHAHLANMFEKLEGYEVEQRVKIRSNLSGTVDLFHIPSGTVIDWKTTNNVESKRRNPSNQNQIQVQLYGYGKAQSGADVRNVALVYLPVTGDLDQLHVELYPYDEQIALDALKRIDNIYELLSTVDVENNPVMWSHIPAVTSRMCNYCPFFKPYSSDLAKGCNGDTKVAA
tara:strand:+ start:124 stop:858 length:735 start_codon:yes stop_codon:yes gene_type:complete